MQNCFLMPSRLKSHIILVLDRLQCVAWVNCLVKHNKSKECRTAPGYFSPFSMPNSYQSAVYLLCVHPLDNIKNDLSVRELSGEEAQDRVQWRRLIRNIESI